MQRIQVMLDDNLADILRKKANDSGLSISSYARILLNERLKKQKLSPMDQAMLNLDDSETDEIVELREFKEEIGRMIKNAKD